MHEHKLSDFNPLDLLATAASLQRPGRETTTDKPSPTLDNSSQLPTMRLDTSTRRTRSASNNLSVDNGKQKSKKLESDLKIYKVVVKNELSKMLEEHNYGHPKRNFRYILHDEPFSSVEKETDLKLMDSNCNEYRDCLESSPQGEATTGSDASESLCDNDCSSGLVGNNSDTQDNGNEESLERMDSSECVENTRNTDTCPSDVNVDSRSGDEDGDGQVPGSVQLGLLETSSKCSGSLKDGIAQTVDGLSEPRAVDRLESCEEEQGVVDVETVPAEEQQTFSQTSEEQQTSFQTAEEQQTSSQTAAVQQTSSQTAEEQQDTNNTLDGFIVSDLCHGCEDPADTKAHGETSMELSLTNDQPSATAMILPTQQNPPDMTAVSGNVKKQTIIRSLLTGETIVVVQKSQNGSKEVGKFPLMVDSTNVSAGKFVTGNCVVSKERSDISSLQEALLSRDTRSVSVDKSNTAKVEPMLGSKLTEPSDIEIARQQNRINSEKLKLACKEGADIESITCTSPDKQLQNSPRLPVASMVPVSVGQPSKDKLVGVKPSSVHSALLSKLSNGISQRKARGAPVLVPSSRLEKFNIGQFASMSSRKIGLVVQAVPKLQVATGKKTPEKAGTMPKYENAAYQQVIRQFPNLAKSVCKEEDLLKMAVAPDDVLECLPTAVCKTPVEDHVLHDHDYCVRGFPVKGSASLLQGDGRLLDDIDREPKLGRPPKNGDRRKKATKRTLEVLGSRAHSPGEDSAQQILPPSADRKSNSELKLEGEVKSVQGKRRSVRQKSGRDSSPSENPDSPDIDGQGDGAKVKITGAFQDDFVYFINKTSRNRRRASEQPHVPATPVVQASDIYIPHLSDADIAALKNKTTVAAGSTGQTNITDEDSKVINTILSMETSLERTETATDGFGFPTPGGDALNGLDLTPEQMDILFSAINGDPSVQKFSQENFGLGPEVELPPVPAENVDPGKRIPVSQAGETFSDAGSQLLGNVDNLHMPNMDLILSSASSLKSNLPTLDPSEVQDSISAITSTSSSVTTLDTGLEAIPSTVDSTVTTPQTHEFSVTAVNAEPKTAPLNGISDLALAPFDKSLDFLGVGDMKADLFPEMGLSQENPAASEANSPWIVTVSMYWNDLPAIMLGNQPYVRLVDIYKQILPAKDTGILKKRCQLLGMEVKNCSEMQRYFLVKYGRGYNSKSTLVVSKDDAKRLIGFYVEPQSRTAKPEGAVDKMPGSPLPASKFRKPASEVSCDSTTSGSVSPGLTKDGNSSDPPSLTAKKDKSKSAGPRTPSKRRMVAVPTGESVSKRLRHKKINFRSMLQGIKREDEVMEGESPLSPAMPSDPSPQPEGEACRAQVQAEPCMPSRRRSRSQSDSADKTFPSQTKVSPAEQQRGDKIIPVRQRSYTSRANFKSPRSHSFGLLKPCSLRQYNLLGKQLRRVKGSFPTNSTLQNVLKKRQLNGTLPASPIKLGDLKTGVPEVDVKQLRSGLSPLAEDRPIQGNLNSSGVILRRASSRRCVVASSAAGSRVRSSGRKRKLKQLYPIENYSYTKKARKEAGHDAVCVQPTPLETSRHLRGRPIVPVRTSPRKKRMDMSSHIEADRHVVAASRSTSEDEENRPKNVITLTNGPEFETFTALTGDFSV